MKNLKTTLYALLLVFPLWGLGGCKNDDDNPTNPIDQLPPLTQTGENTFGCLVNGKPLSFTKSSQLTAIFQQGQLQFGANSEQNGISNSFNLNIIDPLEENIKYFLGDNFYNVGYSLITDVSSCIYEFDDAINGEITFSKIDRVNYIVAGKFEFSTVTNNCEIVNITEGRFDLKYIP